MLGWDCVPRSLPHRLRAVEQFQAGALEAPLGEVTIAFCNVVGANTLLAWNRELAVDALESFQVCACRDLMFGRSVCRPIIDSCLLHAPSQPRRYQKVELRAANKQLLDAPLLCNVAVLNIQQRC